MSVGIHYEVTIDNLGFNLKWSDDRYLINYSASLDEKFEVVENLVAVPFPECHLSVME